MALFWIFLAQDADPGKFMVGFFFGYVILYALKRIFEDQRYYEKVDSIVKYFFIFLKELLVANIQVVKIVLSPKININPGFFKYPMDARTDLGITLIANSITLTPGTITVDIAEDRKSLYIHCVDLGNLEEDIDGIKTGLEQHCIKVVD